MMKNTLLILFILMMCSCGPTYKSLDQFYGFDKCGDLANVECLQTVGWKIQAVTYEGLKDSLRLNQEIDTINIEKKFIIPAMINWRKHEFGFIQLYHEGDEIFYFYSPTDTWRALCGRSGYMIRHGDSLVANIFTILN
jgi:hypothetical protein